MKVKTMSTQLIGQDVPDTSMTKGVWMALPTLDKERVEYQWTSRVHTERTACKLKLCSK